MLALQQDLFHFSKNKKENDNEKNIESETTTESNGW